MRTTLYLDDDLAKKLRKMAHDRHVSLRRVLNETLRRGLGATEPMAAAKPYVVQTFQSSFVAGIDPLKLNQLNDDLDTRAQADRLGK